MKKKITFFELLTLIDKDKIPDAVNYWGNIYDKYADGYYSDGTPLIEAIGLNENMNSLLCEKNISYDEPILTDKEREYLSTVLKPFKNYSFYICKQIVPSSIKPNNEYGFIQVMFMPVRGVLNFPDLTKPMYMGMELGKEYSAEDLGLWKEEK